MLYCIFIVILVNFDQNSYQIYCKLQSIYIHCFIERIVVR